MIAGALFLGLGCAGPDLGAPQREAAQHLLALEQVVLEGADMRLSAATATVDDPQVIQAEVVSAQVGGAPPLEIEAPRSEWDLKARSVRFEGGVNAVRGEVHLSADKLVVQMAQARRVESAFAEGSVRVSRGERRAGSERATLDAATGELRMEGDPWIEEGANRMTGAQITFWLDDDRVVCDRCRLVVDGEALGAP